MPKRKRDIQINFRVSSQELKLIEDKMLKFGTSNREAYLRKMAIDGYAIKLELSELKEFISLMRRNSNNLNQIAKKLHQTGHIYNNEIEYISKQQDDLWSGVNKILQRLSKLK